jgi:cytochrome c biogenesis protein CcdA
MARKDVKAYRPALINLGILFCFSVLLYATNFMGTALFRDEPYISVYYHEYVNKFGYNALLAFAVVYLIVDFWFQKKRTITKYAFTFCISAALLVPLYYPYFEDPLHLYRTEEYSRYLEVKIAHNTLMEEKGINPTQAEINQQVLRRRSQTLGAMGVEDRGREEREIERLSAYLANGSEVVLFWKPLNIDTVYVNVILLGLLILFYFAKFFHDRPHGAYFEKITFLLFLFCSLEALHSWAFTKSADAQLYYSIHSIGQYLIIGVLLGLVYVCSVRLRFLVSPIGQYYERQILLRPERISRWRDEIDQLVLKSFLQKTPFADRLGVLEKDENPLQSNIKRGS